MLNDLVRYDTRAGTWANLTGAARGSPPSPRAAHGFAALGAALYVFGGQDDSGERTAAS